MRHRAKTIFLVGLAIVAALLLLGRVRNVEPEPLARATRAGEPVLSPRADVNVPRQSGAGRTSPNAEVTPVAQSQEELPTAEATPSAECLAARATEAADKAELAAMTPAQVEVAIDAVARESIEGEQKMVRAGDACRDYDGDDHDRCLGAHGLDTSPEPAEEQEASRQFEKELRTQAFRLASRGDARSLVAAAAIAPREPSHSRTRNIKLPVQTSRIPESVDWIVRAQALGRDDAAVQWAVATFSTLRQGSEPAGLLAAQDAARARLLLLEPHNSAAFLLSVHRDGAAGFSRADLARAAALPHHRPFDAGLVKLMLDATQDMDASPAFRRVLRHQAIDSYREHPASAACVSEVELLREFRLTMAVTMATMAMPAIPMMSCQAKELGDSAQGRDDCLRLAEKLHTSGSAVERAFAVSTSRLIAPAGPVRERWQQRHRENRWRQLQMQTASAALDPYEQVRIYERSWRRGDDNMAIDEMLARAGLPLLPPPEWQPPP